MHEGRASDIAIPARDECDLASEFRHTRALWTSPQFRVLTAQHETRRARFGDLFAALIGDIAFNAPDVLAPIDDARFGAELRLPLVVKCFMNGDRIGSR